MKGLEALEKLNHTICLNKTKFNIDTEEHIDCKNAKEFINCYNIIKNELKALETIRTKSVSLFGIKYSMDVDYYNDYVVVDNDKLTKKEFNLLRKVLKNGK